MRKSLATSVCCVLVFSTVLAAAPDVPSSDGSPNRIEAGFAVGFISKAVNREMDRQVRFRRSSAFNQPQQTEPRKPSWIGRHSALFGALVGAGAGALVGVAAEPERTDMPGLAILIGMGAGAGVGAIVGAVVGAVRHRPRTQPAA